MNIPHPWGLVLFLSFIFLVLLVGFMPYAKKSNESIGIEKTKKNRD